MDEYSSDAKPSSDLPWPMPGLRAAGGFGAYPRGFRLLGGTDKQGGSKEEIYGLTPTISAVGGRLLTNSDSAQTERR
jgi:hypothetical protein